MRHQINITENGTTTLATAGKYCDRNIDVNVSVPSSGTESVNAIIDRTITGHYENNEVTKIGAYSFALCAGLESITLPNTQYINSYAFEGCEGLKIIDVGMAINIYGKAIRNCPQLEKLILRRNYVCKLGHTDAFLNSSIINGTGYIYVPDDLVDSYKTATNWSTYASQIKPLSELEE